MEKEQAETPRIDVKRDISINDKIKKKDRFLLRLDCWSK